MKDELQIEVQRALRNLDLSIAPMLRSTDALLDGLVALHRTCDVALDPDTKEMIASHAAMMQILKDEVCR